MPRTSGKSCSKSRRRARWRGLCTGVCVGASAAASRRPRSSMWKSVLQLHLRARAPRPRVGRGEILSPRLGGFAGAPSGSRGAAAAPAPALDTHARNPQAIAASPFAAVASALLASAALPSCPTRLLRRRLRLLWRAVAPGRPSAGRWTFAERKKRKNAASPSALSINWRARRRRSCRVSAAPPPAPAALCIADTVAGRTLIMV